MTTEKQPTVAKKHKLEQHVFYLRVDEQRLYIRLKSELEKECGHEVSSATFFRQALLQFDPKRYQIGVK
jgi:hypothetical protein